MTRSGLAWRAFLGASLALVLGAPASASGRMSLDTVAPSQNERISLAWFDAWGLCSLVDVGAAAETKRILGELGVRIEWVKDEAALATTAPRLNILLIDVEPSSWGLGEHTLGAVHGESGAPGEAVFVFTPNVIRAAGHPPERGSCEVVRMQVQIGRALARVIVHEIIHAVAPGHPHADHGIMNPSLSRVALLDSSVDVDRACALAFLSRLRR